jgi:hypothetical protein
MMHASFWSKKGAETLSRRCAREREGTSSAERRGRGGVFSPESSPEVVGLCENRSSPARSLVAEGIREGVEMNEEREGLFIGVVVLRIG